MRRRPGGARRCLHLHLRVHILPGLRGGHGRHLSELRGRIGSTPATGENRSASAVADLHWHRRRCSFRGRQRRASFSRQAFLNLRQSQFLLLCHRLLLSQKANARAFPQGLRFISVGGHYNSSKKISISFPSRTYSRTLNRVPGGNRTSSSSGYADHWSISLPRFEMM